MPRLPQWAIDDPPRGLSALFFPALRRRQRPNRHCTHLNALPLIILAHLLKRLGCSVIYATGDGDTTTAQLAVERGAYAILARDTDYCFYTSADYQVISNDDKVRLIHVHTAFHPQSILRLKICKIVPDNCFNRHPVISLFLFWNSC